MDNQGKLNGDLLKQYINPERIERAPEGFTSKLMTCIQIETRSMKVGGRWLKINPVPAISTGVIILLIVATFLIPDSETDLLALPVVKLIKNIQMSLPAIDLTNIFKFNLPAMMIYVSIGIPILSLFDRALNLIFRRREEKSRNLQI